MLRSGCSIRILLYLMNGVCVFQCRAVRDKNIHKGGTQNLWPISYMPRISEDMKCSVASQFDKIFYCIPCSSSYVFLFLVMFLSFHIRPVGIITDKAAFTIFSILTHVVARGVQMNEIDCSHVFECFVIPCMPVSTFPSRNKGHILCCAVGTASIKNEYDLVSHTWPLTREGSYASICAYCVIWNASYIGAQWWRPRWFGITVQRKQSPHVLGFHYIPSWRAIQLGRFPVLWVRDMS